MNTWIDAKLGMISDILTGFPFPGKEYEENGILRVIRGENVTIGQLRWDTVKFWNKPLDNLDRYLLSEGDVVIGMDGSRVGQNRSVVRQHDLPLILAQRVARLRPFSNVDKTFLSYLVLSNKFEKYVSAVHTGTSIPHISQSQIADFPVSIPESLLEQRAIAAILSALDDKIELNRQMNKTLEEMAQAIFKEWFVDFGPFRDSGMQDSELGPIPVGWRVEPIGAVAKINVRVRRKDYQHQLIQYIDISSVNQGHLENTTPYNLPEAPSRAQRLVADQDILWSCVRPNRRSYYYVLNPADNLVVSTGFAVLSPEKVPGSYLYQWVTTDQFVEYLTANADGSAYPAVRAEHFSKALCVVPPNDILADFDACVHPMRSNIAYNSFMNTSLAAIRDALLPKLMSGEIRVPFDQDLS